MKKFKNYLEDIFNNEDQEKFYDMFFEYVGANEYLDINKYQRFLEPFISSSECYRVWPEITNAKDFIEGKIDTFQIKQKDYYACTKTMNDIKTIINENDIKFPVLISKHKGRVIDIVRTMEDIIKIKPDPFYKDVYINNKYQNEMLFLDPIIKLSKDNVVAYYNNENNIIKSI